MRLTVSIIPVLGVGLLSASPAAAQQTTNYQYDVQGRLKQAGTTDGARSTAIQYDKANNRTSLIMTKATPMAARASMRTATVTDGSTAADKAVRDAAASVSPYYKQ